MQLLFLSMHAIAAKRDEGLRPELIGLSDQVKTCRTGAENDEQVIASGRASGVVPSEGLEVLNVEVVGPKSLLPYGRKCSLRFGAKGAATITIGIRDYGRGYASSYFASLVVARLGIPATRVYLYYAGNLPAAKINFRDLRAVPNRDSVGCVNAQIGDLIEGLCDAAIEKGRTYFAAAIGGRVCDIQFESASGRFLAPDGRCCDHILKLAALAYDGRRAP
jgi:hypothetical protein